MNAQKIIHLLNIPYHIANHVVGEHHSQNHRRIAGIFVMAIGVSLAHACQHIGNLFISLTGDLIGYSIHATGILPYLHDLENALAKKGDKEEKQNCETCTN